MSELEKESVTLVVEGVTLDLAVTRRAGNRAPILFLHGFGSTKEDYADIVRYPVVLQIAQASAKPRGCSSSQRDERTAIQTEGAAVSLRCSFIRLNWPLRMRCMSSMPEMVVAAVLKRLKPSITFTRALRLR